MAMIEHDCLQWLSRSRPIPAPRTVKSETMVIVRVRQQYIPGVAASHFHNGNAFLTAHSKAGVLIKEE